MINEINKKVADKACRFFSRFLTHTKGQWAGQRFDLLPWQTHIVRNLFGRLKPNGYRQYTTVYVEIGKKNGKSELAAGIALKLFMADDEPGAEVYSAACDTDQARIVFDVAARMIEYEPRLGCKCKIIRSTKRIIHNNSSFYRVLSAEVPSKHGLNTHGVIIDELHAQPNRDLYDVLTQGAGDARRQPVFFFITTAGYDKNSICYEVHDYACKVRDGIIKDPTFLPVLYGADEKEDWTDEKVWEKCNPSLHVIIDIQKVRDACQKAQDSPALENSFRRLRLNQWVKQETRYIPMAAWDECGEAFDPEMLIGQPCYGGLDLASTTDLASFVLLFDIDGFKYVLPYFWIPGGSMEKRVRKDRVPYDQWERAGLLKATPGDSIDVPTIEKDIIELSKKYAIQDVRYDRWGADEIKRNLIDEGFTMIDFGQGWKSMSPPTKGLLVIVLNKTLRHNNHEILRWMADNLTVTTDPAENVKPNKEKSTERIDGIVSTIMALDGTMRTLGPSIYETEGVKTVGA